MEETSFVIILLSLLIVLNIKKLPGNRLVQDFNNDRLSLTDPFDHFIGCYMIKSIVQTHPCNNINEELLIDRFGAGRGAVAGLGPAEDGSAVAGGRPERGGIRETVGRKFQAIYIQQPFRNRSGDLLLLQGEDSSARQKQQMYPVKSIGELHMHRSNWHLYKRCFVSERQQLSI